MTEDTQDEALRWFFQAEEELKDAKDLSKAGRFYLSLYLCQQSAEKALKAFIYNSVSEPIFTHSVSVLIRLASEIDSDFAELTPARRLDDYYIPTRYPNGLPGGIPAQYYTDRDEAERALALSSKVVEMVKGKLGV